MAPAPTTAKIPRLAMYFMSSPPIRAVAIITSPMNIALELLPRANIMTVTMIGPTT